MKIDVSQIKGENECRDYLKKEILEVIYNALTKRFGADLTRRICYDIVACPDDDTNIEIKKGRVITEIADRKDKDGFDVGILADVAVTIKKWNPTYSKKEGITHSAVTLADIDTALEIAEEENRKKEEEKKRRETAKEKKIEADKKRREQRKEKEEGV